MFTLPLLLLTVLLAISISTAAMFFTRKNHFPVSDRLILITGGSQGTGLSLAKALSSKGAHIAIISRSQPKLDAALLEIQSAALSPSQRFLAVSADCTSAPETTRAFREITEWFGSPPEIVWAVAGISVPGLFKDTSSETLEMLVKTNYFSAMHTAHAALNLMVPVPCERKRHIVFTSSTVAFYPICGYNGYSPAKAAIRSLADGLQQECLLYDINVSCIFPGTIFTPGYEEENKTKHEITKRLEEGDADAGQTPEKVAELAIKGLENGELSVTTAFLGSLMRCCMWGGTKRNWWVWDNTLAAVVGFAWAFIAPSLDKVVVQWRKEEEKRVEEERGK